MMWHSSSVLLIVASLAFVETRKPAQPVASLAFGGLLQKHAQPAAPAAAPAASPAAAAPPPPAAAAQPSVVDCPCLTTPPPSNTMAPNSPDAAKEDVEAAADAASKEGAAEIKAAADAAAAEENEQIKKAGKE